MPTHRNVTGRQQRGRLGCLRGDRGQRYRADCQRENRSQPTRTVSTDADRSLPRHGSAAASVAARVIRRPRRVRFDSGCRPPRPTMSDSHNGHAEFGSTAEPERQRDVLPKLKRGLGRQEGTGDGCWSWTIRRSPAGPWTSDSLLPLARSSTRRALRQSAPGRRVCRINRCCPVGLRGFRDGTELHRVRS